MAGSLGTLTLDLVAKIGQFVQPIKDAEEQAKESMSAIEQHAEGAADSIKGMIASGAGLLSLGALFGKYIQNTRDAEQEQAQLAAVLKSTGEAAGYSQDQLNDMANSMSQLSILSGGEINQAQTSLLAFTGIVGDQFPRALQAAIDMSARTGMSVVSAAETIGRALDVPSKGLTALSKQGFRFTEDQKALAEQLERTGNVAEAQGIILDSLESSYKGAAEATRNTFDGALAGLNNTFDDLLTGDGSLQVATNLINNLSTALASPAAAQGIQVLTVGVVGFAAAVGGRMVASTTASAVAFINAQREAARYNAALAAMAGLSGRAATSQLALGAATRGASAFMGVLGGPVGLVATIGLTAASYLILRDNADASNVALETSAKYAGITASQFKNLSDAQKDVAKSELEDAFKTQNEQLEIQSNQFSALTRNIIFAAKQQGIYSKNSGEFIDIQRGVEQGTLSYTEVIERLNKLDFMTVEQKKQLLDAVTAYNNQYAEVTKTNEGLKVFGEQSKIAGSAAQNSATGITTQGDALSDVEKKAENAAVALQKYIDKTKQGIFENQVQLRLRAKGFDPDEAKALTDLVTANGNKAPTSQQAKIALEGVASNRALAASNDRIAESAKAAENAENGRAAAIKKGREEAQRSAENLQKTYQGLLYSMGEQSSLIGKTGETSKLVYRLIYGDLKNLTQAQKENLELTARSLDQRQQSYNFEESKKDLTEQLAIARAMNFEDQKLLELRAQFGNFTADQQAELIIYSKRLDAIKEFKDVFGSSKTEEQKAYEETTRQLKAINYGIQNVTMSEKEYKQAIKDRQALINAAVLPSYTPELTGASSAAMVGMGGKLTGALGQAEEATNAGVALDEAFLARQELLRKEYEGKEELSIEYNERLLALEQEYANKRTAVELGVAEANKNLMVEQLTNAASMFGDLSGLAKAFGGEQSATYKTLFAAQKGFSLASTLINNYKAISDAWADPTAVTLPQKILNAAIVASKTGVLSAAISAVTPQGMAHSGIDSVPQDGTWLLQKGERVTTAQTSAKLDRTLDQVGKNGSGVNITINHDPSLAATARDDGNGNITIDVVRREIAARAPSAVADDLSRGANTVTNTALRRNYKMERQF